MSTLVNKISVLDQTLTVLTFVLMQMCKSHLGVTLGISIKNHVNQCVVDYIST